MWHQVIPNDAKWWESWHHLMPPGIMVSIVGAMASHLASHVSSLIHHKMGYTLRWCHIMMPLGQFVLPNDASLGTEWCQMMPFWHAKWCLLNMLRVQQLSWKCRRRVMLRNPPKRHVVCRHADMSWKCRECCPDISSDSVVWTMPDDMTCRVGTTSADMSADSFWRKEKMWQIEA
jgi:hypothetical protein